MVSGIPTSSGYEERIRFSELEVVESGAIDHGVMNTLPEGHYVNGWDVNVAGVRSVSVKRNIRYHQHAVREVLESWISNANGSRNSYFGSSGREKSNTSLEDDMEISANSTRGYGPSCLERFFLPCLEKISRARQRRI